MTTGTAIGVHANRSLFVGTAANSLIPIDSNVLMEYCPELQPNSCGQDDSATAIKYYGGTFDFGNTVRFMGQSIPEPVEIRDYECMNYLQSFENLGNPIAAITSVLMEAMTGFSSSQKTPGWIWGSLALAAGYVIWKQQAARRTNDRSELPPEIHQRLNELSNLPENWNSYGAPPVDKTALKKTRAILRQIYLKSVDAPKPFIAPGSDGGLGIEFTTNTGSELLVDVHPDGHASYLIEIVQNGTRQEEQFEGEIESEYEILALLARMNG